MYGVLPYSAAHLAATRGDCDDLTLLNLFNIAHQIFPQFAHPDGFHDDGLQADRDNIGQVKTPEKAVEILMERIPRADGVHIWKISNQTVAEISIAAVSIRTGNDLCRLRTCSFSTHRTATRRSS